MTRFPRFPRFLRSPVLFVFAVLFVLLPLSPAQAATWAETTFADLTLEQKVAQLVMVRLPPLPASASAAETRRVLSEVSQLEVGGVVLFGSELGSIAPYLDELQRVAPVPLLVAADLERGLAFRVDRGTVPVPYAMAVGATGSAAAARWTGEVTAREARAVGIHWTFAPVADVNNNPANPVINLRSYGEDPDLVGRMVAAFVEGARAGGLLTAVKHFPGHGDTADDSHYTRPILGMDRARLERVEWPPFRAAIAAGVDAVMVAHVAVPALDPSRAPATFSKVLTAGLLRDELGFQGLIVTDSLEMSGIRPAWTGEAVVRSLQAGADIVLLPGDARVAVQAILRAVARGELTEERLDESVRRVLTAKVRAGLAEPAGRLTEAAALVRDVARPEDAARALEVAQQAITVVRNDGGVLPLAVEKPLQLLHLILSADFQDRAIRGALEAEFEARGLPTETFRLGPDAAPDKLVEILARAPRSTHAVVSLFGRLGRASHDDLPARHAELLRRLHATGLPVVVLNFASPYLLDELPPVPAVVVAYGSAESSQRAAIAALCGESAVTGTLPVTIPRVAARGAGLQLPARRLALTRGDPRSVGFRPDGFAALDTVIDGFLARQAFPGGVVAVGRHGVLAHLRAFGRQSYGTDAPAVTADTLYDLASLTKVIVTTTAAMLLVDDGRLDLDKPVQDFLPAFTGPGKDQVTVRHLLTHSAGIDWWAPLYQRFSGPDARRGMLEEIQAMPLVYPPGSESKYSDLGILLLGEILDRVAGEPARELVQRRLFGPLGMTDTGYTPAPELLPRIAPTEVDNDWRRRPIHGEVHDENAFALGGIAPHAGLFGSATDLARFAQMLAHGGVYDGRRIVSRATVELFTRRAGVPGSSRALGWDTKSATGSSAGQRFGPLSFGHTGFTGTSMWIDPERGVWVVLLTNRVHPTRDNLLIREARPAVADAVIAALDEGPVQVGLDRLQAGEDFGLAGKRLGVLTHAAAVAADGRSVVAVFRERGLQVVRLFSPEHGLAAAAAAGERVASGRDPASGLPVVSLYGDRQTPRAEDLAGLDALVVDLQDAGVRFYTYASTLLRTLEVAAARGLPVVVLDRPNPLGGVRVEGPWSAPREEVAASLVNTTPGPLVHGLTLGELARWVNRGLPRPAPLTVVPMRGWRRSMTWGATGRPWVAPSPNLRSAEAALAYPGVALLEATNVSEGRGTEAPFLRLGAPWFPPLEFAVPGYTATPAAFTPAASPAAPTPKYRGEPCQGLTLTVTDAHSAEPYRLGVSLLAQLSRHPEFRWRDEGKALTRLLGTPRLLAELQAGRSVDEILEGDAADLATWRAERRGVLLYE